VRVLVVQLKDKVKAFFSQNDILGIMLLVLLVVGSLIFIMKSGSKTEYSSTFVNALQDSLHTERNSKGELITFISVLQTQNSKDIIDIKTKDKTLLRLQEALKKARKGNVTVVETNTTIHGVLSLDSSKTKFNFEDKWVSLKGETYPNPQFDLKVVNEPVIKQYIKDGKMVAEYTDGNPYVTVTNMKSFSPLPKKTLLDKIKVGPSITWTPLSGGGFQPGFSVIYSLY
jgi:hypothetical protein